MVRHITQLKSQLDINGSAMSKTSFAQTAKSFELVCPAGS